MADRDIPRDEAEAALHTRRDLGQEYEPAIVDSFVDRLDKVIEARVSDEVAKRAGDAGAHEKALARAASLRSGQALALAIVSIVMAIPLTAIAAESSVALVLLVWGAIVSINLIFALGGIAGRRRH